MVASASYVGQHSGDLQYGGGSSFGNSFSGDVNVYAGDLLQHLTCTPTGQGQAATCSGTQTRLNTSFGAINYTFNGPWSNYSALILALQGRFAHRGFVDASYTRATSKDNSGALPIGNYPIEYSLSRFYGPSAWDAPNRFSLGWSYLLPGVHDGHGFLGRVASGWEVASTTILQSGLPFTVASSSALDVAKDASGTVVFRPDSGDFNADGDNNDFPDVSTYHMSHSRRSYITGVFPHCSGTNLDSCGPFTLPAVGQEGNEQVNQFRNPGFAETDASLKKITNITERVKFELRIDYFNLFNRVNLNGVNIDAASGSTFGTSTSTQIPRQGQLGARIDF